MRDLTGKTALMTGAASGTGIGIAKPAARAGAKIVPADPGIDSSIAGMSELKL